MTEQHLLTLSESECLNQPEPLSWSERLNTPEYIGTFILCTIKQCHQIITIYFSSSHVMILKFHWQVSTFRNAGYIASVAMQFCSRAQWFSGRASDSRLREPGFESCAAVLKPWASFFTLHCSSSLNCINEYLTIGSGGYVYEQPSCINCSIWLDASQRSRNCVSEVKCKAL